MSLRRASIVLIPPKLPPRNAAAGWKVGITVAPPDRVPLATRLGDPDLLIEDEPGGEVPERHDHRRLHVGELGLEVRTARIDLVLLGVPVTRGPALHHVDDRRGRAIEPDIRQKLVEQLPGSPDEGDALFVFMEPRALADEQQIRIEVPVRPDHVRAPLSQAALRTDEGLSLDVLDRGVGGEGLGHPPTLFARGPRPTISACRGTRRVQIYAENGGFR